MLFLSYRTRRAPELGPLRRALDAAGWELWRDEERVAQGERLTAAVQEGIAAANALIVWYTDDYEQSAICRWELRRAWIASGAELPVRIYLLCAPGVAAPAHFPPELIYRAEDLPSFLSALRPPSAPFGPPPALPLVLPFPRPSSPRFVGRVPELWRLHQLLSQPGSVQVRGLGGLGKSLLVVEYANQFTAAWPGGIFWVEGDDLRMADLLGLPPGEEELRRTALRQHLLQRGPYLWILDDRTEESPDAPTANGQTLRTTRSTDRPGKSLDLEGLGEEEALGLLALWRPVEKATDSARRLCATLGHLPLALELLGALLRREPDPEPYPTWERKLAQPGRDALALAEKLREELPTGSSRNLATVLGSSLALLEEAGWDLLLLMAELADAPLPRSFCAALLGEAAVEAGLHQAQRLSLLREEEGNFLLHPVLRRVLRLRKDREEQRRALGLQATGALLHTLQGVDLSDPRLHAPLFELLPHARSRTEGTLEEGSTRLLALLAELDHAAGRDARARAGWERVLAREGEPGGPGPEQSLTCRQNLAVVLARLGELDRAQQVAKEAWKGRCLLLGEHHPESLSSRQNLGVILSQAGEEEEACHHFTEVLAATTSEDQRLLCLQNLALSYKKRDNLQESRRIYEEILPLQAARWGAAHPNRARSLQNLGACLLALGETAAAEQAIQEAVGLLTAALGPDHPDRLTALGNLATVWKAAGRWTEAAEGYRSIYQQRRALLGPDHPDSLVLLQNLGTALHNLGNYREALRCYEEAASAQERVLGAQHPARLATLENQAVTLQTLGDRAGARQIYTTLLEQGADPRSRLAVQHNLAGILQEEGDQAGAHRLYEQVLHDRTQLCGEEHPETLLTLNNLAGTLYFQGALPEARAHFERLFNARRRRQGEQHPDSLLALQSLALVKQAQGQQAEARADLEAAYAGLSAHLGDDHPTVLVVLQNLAVTLQQLGDAAAARQHYETVLQRHARVFGMDHPGSLRILQNLAATEYALGDLHGARAHYEQALSRLTRQWGDEHPDTQLCRFNLLYPLFPLDPAAANAQVDLLQRLRKKPTPQLNAAEQQILTWLNQYFPVPAAAPS